ncbi:Hypothetical predicted protein [Paramuricea clavata]|uniref:Uncharacterized protein n=1 Tax=Paramuricea clavata TaxID=317549 RepID=A0A6S7FY12_PARCT|nr:Hypothetical predicted protein [Paramuricea clavata]
MKTCKKFPELKDLTGSRYWGTVKKQLSQYFRNQRRYSEPKPTLPSQNEGKGSSVEIAKLEPQVMGMETQKRNMALLKD